MEKPCCYSERECAVRYHAVVSIKTRRVLRYVNAVRCERLPQRPKYKFYPTNDVVLVEHYRSNRGKVSIKILWKPENISDYEVLRTVCQALGYELEEVLN